MSTEHGTDRRLRADARRNRTRVLEVAERVFVEEGLAVPVDEIARRAGVGVGTVYRHFPTKDALFETIVVDRVQWLVDEARRLADADDPGAAFFRYLRDMVDLSSVNKWLYEALIDTGGDTKRRLTVLSGELKEALGELLRRAQDAAAVRRGVSPADVKALLTGAQTAIREGAARDTVADVLCDGLRAGSAVS